MAAYEDIMEKEAPDPAAMLADKGYESDAIRTISNGAAPTP